MKAEYQNTLHQLLKQQTIALHNKAHKIPYVENFLKNNISIISYTGHLRALAIIYGTLEYQISNLKNPEIKVFLEDYSPKLPLILSDLEYLKADEVKDIIPAISNALHVADNVLLNSVENPYKLLGYFYTLEGSLNGGNVLKKHISETFNFQNNEATKYLSCFDEKFKNFWDNFIDKLNTKIVDNQQKEDIISGASELFYDLMNIFEALFPINEETLGNHITSLNPEAGNYPIPTNPLEIKAAISAGMICWNEFPYYQKRYGERGRRFTVSDVVWLVTLCELPENEAIKQVNWLAKLLAARGMPTYTMEFQLQTLYHELSKSIPEKEQQYLKLLKASEHLNNQRIIQINESDFENCNVLFDKYFEECNITDKNCGELKKNMGKLMASSIVDSKNGISGGKDPLEIWLKNKDIFPENWILAVEKFYLEMKDGNSLNSSI